MAFLKTFCRNYFATVEVKYSDIFHIFKPCFYWWNCWPLFPPLLMLIISPLQLLSKQIGISGHIHRLVAGSMAGNFLMIRLAFSVSVSWISCLSLYWHTVPLIYWLLAEHIVFLFFLNHKQCLHLSPQYKRSHNVTNTKCHALLLCVIKSLKKDVEAGSLPVRLHQYQWETGRHMKWNTAAVDLTATMCECLISVNLVEA